MLREAGDDCLKDVPVLAARLAIQRGDLEAARRWVAAADAGMSRNPDDQVALAGLERELGRPEAGYARLKRYLAQGAVTVWAIESFAQLALEARRATEASPMLDRLRGRFGAPADAAWARVATAAGERRAVLAWLQSSRARRVPAQALRDIAYQALDGRMTALAVEAARLLLSTGATRDDRLLLARALSEDGQAEAALDVLRPLALHDRTLAATYDAALARAATGSAKAREELTGRVLAELEAPSVSPARRAELARTLIAGGAVAPALQVMEPLVRADGGTWLAPYLETAKQSRNRASAVAFLTRELERGDLAAPFRETRVRALLELGASEAAEPFLRDLATRDGGAWVFAYDDALAARGNRAARAEWWRSRGLRTDVPAPERRAAAFKLIDLRDKGGAEQVLRVLAEQEPSDGPNTATLLHLWGPRPARPALEWLEARARSAQGHDQAGWLEHLTSAGAAARTLAILATAPGPDEPARLDAWIDAQRAVRDRDGLRRTIERAAALSHDAGRLEALAQVALAESLPDAAERAFETLIAIQPGAQEARRWLGLLALARNDAVAAREHLEHYVAGGGRDPEALLRQGELLERDSRPDAARRAFALGLQASDRADRRTVAARRTHAFLLAHAGRAADAQRGLEALVAEQPTDAHLRADYAAWLLKEGRHADAQRILDLR